MSPIEFTREDNGKYTTSMDQQDDVSGAYVPNLDYGLLEIHSNHTGTLLKSCELALADRDACIGRAAERITQLQQQNAELVARNAELKSNRLEALSICSYAYDGLLNDMTRHVAREWLRPARDLYVAQQLIDQAKDGE